MKPTSYTQLLKRLTSLVGHMAGIEEPKPRKQRKSQPKVVARRRRIMPAVLPPVAVRPVEVPVVVGESHEQRIIRLVAEAQAQRAAAPTPKPRAIATRRQCDVVDGSCNRRCALLEGHPGHHRHARGTFIISLAPRRELDAVAWGSTS